MSWKKFQTKFFGYEIDGDTSMPETRWWNHLWLLWFGWRVAAVMEVSTDTPYRVGFRDFRGKTMLCDTIMTSKRFRAMIGHEPCHFFAIDEQGYEIELVEITRVPKTDVRYGMVPLI